MSTIVEVGGSENENIGVGVSSPEIKVTVHSAQEVANVEIIVDEFAAQRAIDAADRAEEVLENIELAIAHKTDRGGFAGTSQDLKNEIDLKLNISDYNEHFKGKFTSLANLQTAIPIAEDGDYAIVDVGAGVSAKEYIWDLEEGWVISGSVGPSTTDALAEGSTNLYFTSARVLAVTLSGLSALVGGPILATDTILVAFGKIKKDILDIFTALSNIFQPDVLVSSVPPTRVGNTFTYPALGYTVLISKTTRQNPAQLVTTIGDATAGFYRTDLIWFKDDNTLQKVIGTENATAAERPTVPLGQTGVPVSYINVFGNVISTPIPIINQISIQDSLGAEQFKVPENGFVRFKGVTFNNAAKQIEISPLQSKTAFVDTTLGNNTTAELENSKKPFASIDGVFARYTADQPATAFIKIFLVNAGTYAWNNKIYNISFEMYSDKNVTVDLTGAPAGSIYINTNVAVQYTVYFNMPLGRLYNNKGNSVAGASFDHEDTSFVLNLNAIYWNVLSGSTERIFSAALGVSIQNLLQLSTTCRLGAGTNTILTPIKLSTLTILAGCTDFVIGTTAGVEIDRLILNSNVLLFHNGESWTIGNITGVLHFQFSHGTTFKINFKNSVISGGINFVSDQGNITFTGIIESTSIAGTISALNAGRVCSLNLVGLTILNLTSNGFLANGSYFNLRMVNCYFNQTTGAYLVRHTGKSAAYTPTYAIEKTTFRQATPASVLSFDNNNQISSINIGGLETNALSISNIQNTPIVFDIISFKDKQKEIVIRSKIDILGRVLDSTITYIIDGPLILLTGEYIEVPAGGLTITGYGVNASSISKNVSGQSIFISPAGNSGDFFSKDITYNPGLGSVFNITDATGGHAIELNDVNFNGVTGSSLGILNGYRQFTGTTLGFYGLSDGLTLEGNWSGFKLTNSNIISFGASGTLFKKGAATVFSNRFYIDLNLQVATGSKICDFAPANFTNNKSLQVVNCYLKVNGVIDATTTATTFPNITETSSKANFVNNIGIKNSNITPYGISADNLLTYSNDAAAASGGVVQIGQIYIEASTGYPKVRLI